MRNQRTDGKAWKRLEAWQKIDYSRRGYCVMRPRHPFGWHVTVKRLYVGVALTRATKDRGSEQKTGSGPTLAIAVGKAMAAPWKPDNGDIGK